MVTTRKALYVFAAGVMVSLLMPALALAEEAVPASGGAWQEAASKYMAAALAIGLSALAAAYAQARIGAAGAGTLAERPEERIWIITMEAIPEIIVLLGFVTALMIINR